MTTAIPQRRGSFFQNKTFIPKVICLAVKITPETETFGYDQLHRLSSIDSQTITYKEKLPKQQALLKFLNETDKKTIAVFDNNDLDFVAKNIRNRKVEVMPFSALKKTDTKNKVLVFHSFNGQKDFDYLYNLDNEIRLILYKQEKNLYYKYLDQRKKLIEEEIKSKDRFKICGVEYIGTRDSVTDISTTINGIVSRLDEMNGKAYESYKNECDLLLNEIEEKLIYKVTSNRATLFLESNDTIFTDRNYGK